MNMLKEFADRRVWRVISGYALVCFVVLQLADVTFEPLDVSDAVLKGIIATMIVGIPVVAYLAWVFDVGANDRLRRVSAKHPRTELGVAAFAIAVFAGGCFMALQAFEPTPSATADPSAATPVPRAAVAVMPFENLSRGAAGVADDLLPAHLADELILQLSQWRNLPVINRASSFSPSLPTDVSSIGQHLDARYLVYGSVTALDSVVRVSIQIVDSVSEQIIWSLTERQAPSEGVMALAESLSHDLVAEINPALIAAESKRSMALQPRDIDAWTAAMRGWWHMNTETEEGLTASLEWYDKAIELDPAWGWPHAALALAHYRSLVNGWSPDAAHSVTVLTQMANRAVQLDPEDSFGQHALGHALTLRGSLQDGLQAFARGVELGPNNAMARACYGMQLAALREADAALVQVDEAFALSPNDPWQHRFALVRARAHFAAERFPESETWALRSQQLKPSVGAFLHSVAAPALNNDLARAVTRLNEAPFPSLPKLANIERSFKRGSDSGYVDLLLAGLRSAGMR